MADLKDGETFEMQGSGSRPYVLKNVGGVYSCSCPAWRNQSLPIERRTCKHLRKLRGDEAEELRVGSALAAPPRKAGGVGEKEGPPVLLAEAWDTASNLAGWWMSEKLDGVRAYWDGKQFLSRLGNVYYAPDWFVAGLPDVPLDGELWLGRKAFQRTVSIARRQDRSEHWRELRYVVFDAPAHGGEFEARLEFLRGLMRKHSPEFVSTLAHELCRDLDHLRAELARVEALGGEGLMLRQPGSMYVAGRSATLLKVKSFRDAEARVVGHEPGAGRHKGRLGALLVELENGKRFAVGTGFSDAERASPPSVGSVIQFRYQELSEGGVPRFPRYVGLMAAEALLSASAAAPAEAPGVKRPAKADRAVPEPVSVSDPSPASVEVRRFEYLEEGPGKFWEVSVSGNEVRLRYGTIGTPGQTKTETFAGPADASQAAAELIADKVDDGFVEGTAPAREGARPAARTKKSAPAPEKAAPPAASPATGPAGVRRFEYVQGTSSKFWEVWVSGSALSTRYGRIGSQGQTTVKSFPDEAKAAAAAAKLIGEKVGKGYIEK
jgi:DNA ligase-1